MYFKTCHNFYNHSNSFSQQEAWQKILFLSIEKTGFSVSPITDSRCKCVCLIKVTLVMEKTMECN